MNINSPPETHQLGITCFVQRLTKGEEGILGAHLSKPLLPDVASGDGGLRPDHPVCKTGAKKIEPL